MEKKKSNKLQKDISESDLIKIIDDNDDLKKHFVNKEIIKHIYVKNKIINYILK